MHVARADLPPGGGEQTHPGALLNSVKIALVMSTTSTRAPYGLYSVRSWHCGSHPLPVINQLGYPFILVGEHGRMCVSSLFRAISQKFGCLGDRTRDLSLMSSNLSSTNTVIRL